MMRSIVCRGRRTWNLAADMCRRSGRTLSLSPHRTFRPSSEAERQCDRHAQRLQASSTADASSPASARSALRRPLPRITVHQRQWPRRNGDDTSRTAQGISATGLGCTVEMLGWGRGLCRRSQWPQVAPQALKERATLKFAMPKRPGVRVSAVCQPGFAVRLATSAKITVVSASAVSQPPPRYHRRRPHTAHSETADPCNTSADVADAGVTHHRCRRHHRPTPAPPPQASLTQASPHRCRRHHRRPLRHLRRRR